MLTGSFGIQLVYAESAIIMRKLTSFGSVFVLLSLLSTKPSGGQIITGPVNTAAPTGTREQLNCSVTLGTDILAWSYWNSTSSTLVRIYQTPNSDVSTGLEDQYSISNNGDEYNLVVKEVNPSVATMYQCQLLVGNEVKQAGLVAVEELQCQQPSVEVVERNELLLPCSVIYHFSVSTVPMAPTLTWSIGTNQNNSVQTPYSNISYVENVLNVTLLAQDDGTEFTCDLRFEGTDAPEYTASCITTVYVLHGVTEISTNPNITENQEVEVGTVITCITNGRPAPSIEWYNGNGTAVASDNENLTVTEDMVGQGSLTFKCQASNTVANTTYPVGLDVTFIAVDVSQQTVSSYGVETWVIVVAVVVPVVVLTASGIAAFFIFRHHQKKKSKKPKGVSTTASTATFTAVEPTEGQPFLYTPNQPPPQQPLASPRSVNNDVSYQPSGGQPRTGSTSGFADLGVDGAMPVTAAAGGASIGGSQYSGSSSRIATPNPVTYPYARPAAANGVNGGPGPVVGGRGTPAITAGPQLAAYAGSTGRLTPATDVSMRTNPVNYPYSGPARQTSNASSASHESSYHGGSKQNLQQPPLSYPPAQPGSRHNSSLV